MYSLDYFLNFVKEANKEVRTMVVAAPHDEATLSEVCNAHQLRLIRVILVGRAEKINEVAKEYGYDISDMQIIEGESLEDIAALTVEQVVNGKADMIMKGVIDTSILLKTILKKEYNLRTGRLLSHVGIFYKDGGDRYYIFTDAGMNIAPNVEQKKQIIENAVEVAHALGNEKPNVAMLCAKEKVYDKMPATVEAEELRQMNVRGEITGCVVSGPLQMDNAVSAEAAQIKGITDPVAGKADILVVPDIEAGNITLKAVQYLGGYTFAGLIMGAKVPVVLASRVDGETEKLLAITLSCIVASKGEANNV